MTAADPVPAKTGEIRLEGAQPGRIGKALAESLAEARRADVDLDRVVVSLAEYLAGVVDAAWRASEARLLISASNRLLSALQRLELVDAEPRGGGDDDDDIHRALDRELADILGSGPTLRDPQES